MKQILLVAFTIFSIAGFAQKDTKINFQKGQKLEMTMETKAVISQEMAGQSIDINVASTLTRAFDIEDVKNGAATIEHKVKRLQFNFDIMGQTQSFDSEKEEDRNSDMGKNIEKALKNKYSMVVDQAGKVVSVKKDDDNPNADATKKDATDPMSSMMGQFAEGMEVPTVGDLIPLKVAVGATLSKGQSWTDSLNKIEKGTTKYTVSDVTGNEVLIDYISEGVTDRKQDMNGMEMVVSIKNKTTGKITLDKKTGLLKQRTINSEGTGNIEMAGQSIPMNTKVTGTINVSGY